MVVPKPATKKPPAPPRVKKTGIFQPDPGCLVLDAEDQSSDCGSEAALAPIVGVDDGDEDLFPDLDLGPAGATGIDVALINSVMNASQEADVQLTRDMPQTSSSSTTKINTKGPAQVLGTPE